jgi:hypothetical protein
MNRQTSLWDIHCWRDNCLRPLRKRKAAKRKEYCCDYGVSIFHKIIPFSVVVLCDFRPFTDVLRKIFRSLTRKVWIFKTNHGSADAKATA